MGQEVRGVVATAKGAPVTVETIVVPDPGPGEAVVAVRACGVCHTDLHYREGGINDDFPFLLGHEAAGVVESVGPDVRDLAPGDFVVLNWRAVCGECRACRRGRPWYCFATHNATQKMTLADGTALSPALGIGAFADKTLVAAGQCTKVNPAARPEAVGLLGCGVMAGLGAAMFTGNVGLGDSVAVFGCGGVGCAAIAGAKLAGAAVIIGVDLDPGKLEPRSCVRRDGSTWSTGANDPVEAIRALTDGNGADVCIEAVGNPKVMEQAFARPHPAGTLVQVGVPTPDKAHRPGDDRLSRRRRRAEAEAGTAICPPPAWTSRCSSICIFDGRASTPRPLRERDDRHRRRRGRRFARMERGEVLRSVVVGVSLLRSRPFGLMAAAAAAWSVQWPISWPRSPGSCAGRRRLGGRRRSGDRSCHGERVGPHLLRPWGRRPGHDRPSGRSARGAALHRPRLARGPTAARDMRAEGMGTTGRWVRRHPQRAGSGCRRRWWLALHERYGRLPLERVLAPAIELAEDGFPASIMLAFASHLVHTLLARSEFGPEGLLDVGDGWCVPGIARTLRAVAREGRAGFYGGEFGRGLRELGAGHFSPDDFATSAAQWCEPLRLDAWGHQLWTVPPPSQGYLTLAGAAVAERAGLGADPDDPRWAHLLVEAWRAVGHDRPDVLFDGADGGALLSAERLAQRRRARASAERAAPTDVASASGDGAAGAGAGAGAGVARIGDGDTTHFCACDADGLGVSLTQSNALDFGSHLVEPSTGVFLHNRGVGFSLVEGHPAEVRAGMRPAAHLLPGCS